VTLFTPRPSLSCDDAPTRVVLNIDRLRGNYRDMDMMQYAFNIISDGTIHRMVSNIAILKAYRIVLNIAIIPSQTIRYFALLY